MSSPHTQPKPAPSPSPSRRGRSKAQTGLFKILRIISLFPPVDVSYKQRFSHDGNTGFDVDLNIGLSAPTEIEPLEYSLAVTGGADSNDCVFLKNDSRKSGLLFVEKPEAVEEERATEQSEISHVGDQSSGIDCNGFSEEVGEQMRDEGFLDLLIEAAQLILGDECQPPSNETEPSRNKYVESPTTADKGGGTKRKKHCWTTTAAAAEWYAEFDDTSPVVKSKRGRNQVLPFKYRDSVLEPLVRWPSSRQRSNSGAAFPSKRRSK